MKNQVGVGRLAFRVEGELWNCYWTPRETDMADAMVLGAIRVSAATRNPALKVQFMRLMQDAFAEIIEEVTGQRPKWSKPRPGPENERSGSA